MKGLIHISAVAAALVALSAGSVRASIIWDCITDAGQGYLAETYVRGVSVYYTTDTLYLTQCVQNRALRVEGLGRVPSDSVAKDMSKVHQQLLTSFIAKRGRWSFGEAAQRLSSQGYDTSLIEIVPDGCLCELEE
ncbi:MAG: hypothetical protein AAGD04_11950 [Pseudomonadota bacterium]